MDSIGSFGTVVLAFGSIWLVFGSRNGSAGKRAKSGSGSHGIIGGLMGMRRRAANSMAGTIMGGLDGVLNPKGPSPEDLRRMEEREKAKKDLAFHSY